MFMEFADKNANEDEGTRKLVKEDLAKIVDEYHCWIFGDRKTKVTDEYGLMVKIAERKSPQKI